jgi:hypothetical protein
MPAPCNACPVEFPDSSGTPLGIPQGGPISLGSAPWNEIRPKKYLSPGIPFVPLWQNSCNLSCAIPLGPAPWNLYHARNVNTNGHIEGECFNLLKPDVTISLGPSIPT